MWNNEAVNGFTVGFENSGEQVALKKKNLKGSQLAGWLTGECAACEADGEQVC